jgi:hypothetical protein
MEGGLQWACQSLRLALPMRGHHVCMRPSLGDTLQAYMDKQVQEMCIRRDLSGRHHGFRVSTLDSWDGFSSWLTVCLRHPDPPSILNARDVDGLTMMHTGQSRHVPGILRTWHRHGGDIHAVTKKGHIIPMVSVDHDITPWVSLGGNVWKDSRAMDGAWASWFDRMSHDDLRSAHPCVIVTWASVATIMPEALSLPRMLPDAVVDRALRDPEGQALANRMLVDFQDPIHMALWAQRMGMALS